jgi:hypothetical protein
VMTRIILGSASEAATNMKTMFFRFPLRLPLFLSKSDG